MANINPINFGIITNSPFKKEQNEGLAAQGENKNPVPAEQKNIPNQDVLGFMSAQNNDLIPAKVKRTVKVSDYVTPEQEARIASMMNSFTKKVDEVSNAAQNEFPDLSQSAADAIALEYMNA